MKGGKDEVKQMDPLFPRLRINDAEKGGPRAPPRNKMALCEQLSIPSQRFTSGSVPMLPLLPNNSSSLVPSASSSHGGSHKGSVFSPFCTSPVSPQLAERLRSNSSGGVNFTTLANLEWQPMKPTNYQTLSATGYFTMTAEGRFFQPHSFSNSKNTSVKKLGDEDDFRVPTFGHLGKTPKCGNGQQNMDNEKYTYSGPNCSGQLHTACEMQLKRTDTTYLKSRLHSRNQTEENPKLSETSEDCAEKPASILLSGDETLADASASPLAKGRTSEPVNRAVSSLNQKKGSSFMDDLRRLRDPNAQSRHEYRILQENNALRESVLAEPKKATRKRSASTLEGVSCCRASLGDNHRSPNRLETLSECYKDRDRGSLQVGDADRNGDISDNSVVDSISGLDISPDDVVGVIGQKQFWKARRTIVHQQRVFAVQVFELHRLIKVQRLIAGSPELLFEDKFYLGKPLIKVSPVNKLLAENLEPPPLIVKPKVDSQKPNPSNTCAAQNAVRKPLPPLNNDAVKGHVTQQSDYRHSVIPTPASIAADAKPAPWSFHPPPGNQWLVPVRSPSEGLVYKPYTGPCPPTSGFMAPVYGNCGPMSITPVGGDFLNTAYGVPASHQQGTGIFSGTPPLGQTYFPPYGMPVMNPSGSNSAVERVSPFARARTSGQDNEVPLRDINFIKPYQSSCNISSQKSGVITDCVRTLQASKESDLQGSSTSSPAERVQGDALPLFPTAPTVQVSDQPAQNHSTEQRIQVIKVVPHNPKSASESAARIFQSIQEERKQYD